MSRRAKMITTYSATIPETIQCEMREDAYVFDAIDEALASVGDSKSLQPEYVVTILRLLGITDFEIA